MDLKDKIKEIAYRFAPELIEIRRHLHRNPELSFHEFKTSEFIARQLEKRNIPFEKGMVKTGIIASIEGVNPQSKRIALRGDMDALPITETNEVDYCSQNNGVMHACGHDVHTTSLLGCAFILNELRAEFEGTINLVFQPGEELLPGGAKMMIDEGLLEKICPENMFGQHVYPELPAGKVGFKPGMYMASADELYVTVKGKGGHAALPHQTVDAVLIAANLIVSLQQVVSRKAPPTIPSVLSFGYVEARGATNILPDEVKLKGTFRTFDEKWRSEAHIIMKHLASNLAISMGGSCDFDIKVGYPFLINDADVTLQAKQKAIEFLGSENVVDLEMRMTAEDFAYFSQKIPSVFYRLGTGFIGEDVNRKLHTSNFDVDEKCIEIGSGLMTYIAISRVSNIDEK